MNTTSSSPPAPHCELLHISQNVVRVSETEADVRDADVLVVSVHAALQIRGVELEGVEPVGDDPELAVGRAVLVKWTAVSFTIRRSVAMNSRGSVSGSSRMSMTALASAGMTFVLFEPCSPPEKVPRNGAVRRIPAETSLRADSYREDPPHLQRFSCSRSLASRSH